jgi:hypothetical protein
MTWSVFILAQMEQTPLHNAINFSGTPSLGVNRGGGLKQILTLHFW